MSRFQMVPFAISANFGFNFSVIVYAGENPYRNGQFLVGFYPMKSDKLALIEDKILNLMFLNIYIPAVLIENWLRVTHSQRQKLSVTSVLLFRHILKTTPWLECGFNLLNSRM